MFVSVHRNVCILQQRLLSEHDILYRPYGGGSVPPGVRRLPVPYHVSTPDDHHVRLLLQGGARAMGEHQTAVKTDSIRQVSHRDLVYLVIFLLWFMEKLGSRSSSNVGIHFFPQN